MLSDTTTSELSSPMLMGMCIVMLLAWAGAYLVITSRRNLALKIFCAILRMVLGFAAMLVVFKYMSSTASLLTPWPIWVLCLMAACGVETVTLLYIPQLKSVSKKTALVIMLLRTCFIVGIVIMLSQPAWTWKTQKKDRKTVVVLIDNSASMHVVQPQDSKVDMLRIAESTGRLKRPAHFEQTQFDIQRVSDDMSDWFEWLSSLKTVSDTNRIEQYQKYSPGLAQSVETAAKTINSASRSLTATDTLRQEIPSAKLTVILEVIDQTKLILDTQAAPCLERISDLVKPGDNRNIYQLVTSASAEFYSLIDSLKKAGQKAKTLAGKVDSEFYETLSASQRQEVDRESLQTRYDIAWDILARSRKRIGGKTYAPSLLQQLVNDFDTRLVTFASRSQELDVTQWSQESAMVLKDLPKSPEQLGPEKQKTDLADALRHAAAISRDTSLAGVLVLSDMRHNSSEPLDPIVQYLAKANVSVYPILAGATSPPTDAAVMSVETPSSVFPEDEMAASIKIKLTGLQGKPVAVNLIYNEKIVDSRTITPESQDIRKTVELKHGPGKTGTYSYKVRIDPIEGEVLTTNNEYSFSLSVKDDKTRVLYIDNRPRWEFRYLKNLFDTRDATVKFQYVLLTPDTIQGQANLPLVRPSAALAGVATRATALPNRIEDWMNFDVIILGDLAPLQLGYNSIDAICEFVTQNGGTLIFAAGTDSMPNAYASTKFAEILPVETDFSLAGIASPDTAFKIALSDEGVSHIITQQSTSPQTNQQIWDSFTPLFWRCAIKAVKPAASVLAYADTAQKPAPPTSSMAPAQRRQRMKEIDDYIKSRALITIQNVSLGKVMLVGYDSTWKMRYRVGDTYHHRFWGQVLRWAISDKMMNGTGLVKIGTDNARYKPDRNVKVKARILNPDFSPLVIKEVPVIVYREDKIAARQNLKADVNSPGMYFGDLSRITEGGAYRVELGGVDVNKILEHEGKAGQAFSEFSVDNSTLDEQIELTIDTKLARLIARQTNGAVLTAADARGVLPLLGDNIQSHPVNVTWTLWDSWYFLAALIMLATFEWIIRKSAGLS